MPEYLSPGVYMEEVDKGPKPIEGVGTAMPVFIGFTERAEEPASGDRDARKFANKPELVTSWKQYNEKFGSYVAGAYLPQSVEGYFINGGNRCYVLSVRQLPPAEVRLLNKFGKEGLLVRMLQASIPGKMIRIRIGAPPPPPKDEDEVNASSSSQASPLRSRGNNKTRSGSTAPGTPGDEQKPPNGDGQPPNNASAGTGQPENSDSKNPLSHFQLIVEQQTTFSEPTKDLIGDDKKEPLYGQDVGDTTREPQKDGPPIYFKVLEVREYIVEQRDDKKFDVKMIFTLKNQKRLVSVQVPEKFSGQLDDLKVIVPQVHTLMLPNLSTDEVQRLGGPAKAEEFKGKFDKNKGELVGMQAIQNTDDITMVVVPDLMTVLPETPSKAELDGMTDLEKQALTNKKEEAISTIISVQTAMIDLCSQMKDRVAILDTPPGLVPTQARDWRMLNTGFDSSYAAMYYPWIEVMDPITNRKKFMPPSGHMAGVWARSDNTRGVHKAPANEVVRGAEGLAYYLTKGEHDILNPVNLNCIRQFPGMGYRVWGARTLSSVSSWKYLNIRRLFNYVEKSIERGTQWVVFEPNEPRTWARLTRDVRAFLLGVWRNGALYGLSPEEAFYVKCDEDLNPSESRREGKLIIEIGMAPVYPAEFVIFRISQWAGPGEDEA